MKISRYKVMEFVFGIIEELPTLAKLVNRWAINRVVNRARVRPHPLSTVHDYVSWRGLTDRRWSGRHLPPEKRESSPDIETLMGLYRRPDGTQRLCPKSTCLFPTFAQYLTDGFLRTESEGITSEAKQAQLVDEDFDPETRLRRNTSNHEIDLCTLYGRTHIQTMALRLCSNVKGKKGRLKSQDINGEEYSPFLYNSAGTEIVEEFVVLDPPLGQTKLPAEQKAKLFAVGGDRVNSVPQTSMLNTLLLREHNRLAGEIETTHPDWDDTRVFETTRNTIIVLFIKIVVEDYINHISPLPFTLRADPSVAWNAPWNKPNWITAEFSLLYRWHALIPDQMMWAGQKRPVAETFRNNALLIEDGLRQAFINVSATPAAELGPQNTAEPLLDVERASILQDRDCNLAGFSDYCAYLKQKRPANWSRISTRPDVAKILEENYTDTRDVEFFVGLFCEDRVPNSPLPNLVLVFVALDAFSQALTNPLLSKHVFKPSTFSDIGWDTIQNTATLRDVLDRNVEGGLGDAFVGMTRQDWQPE